MTKKRKLSGNLSIPLLVKLLEEAREHVTEKPWDDDTCLHARISQALGLPIEYEDYWRVQEVLYNKYTDSDGNPIEDDKDD